MRAEFFGEAASTNFTRHKLEAEWPNYRHHSIDIRDTEAVKAVFAKYGSSFITLVVMPRPNRHMIGQRRLR